MVQASGRSATIASQNLRQTLQNRVLAGRQGDLTGMSRFADAVDLWLARVEEMVDAGARSPATVDTYQRQLKNHILPAMGQVRLGEATTPLVDKVIGTIKRNVSPATAKSCRSVISGVMGLAVRQGAIMSNPVREVERIEANNKREPRALNVDERARLLTQLQSDEVAVRRDLPDLVFFMLSTGCRIGEALAAMWSEVDLDAGTVQITSTLVRIRGEGLLRKGTKTKVGGANAAIAVERRGDAATQVHGRSPTRSATFSRRARWIP